LNFIKVEASTIEVAPPSAPTRIKDLDAPDFAERERSETVNS